MSLLQENDVNRGVERRIRGLATGKGFLGLEVVQHLGPSMRVLGVAFVLGVLERNTLQTLFECQWLQSKCNAGCK